MVTVPGEALALTVTASTGLMVTVTDFVPLTPVEDVAVSVIVWVPTESEEVEKLALEESTVAPSVQRYELIALPRLSLAEPDSETALPMVTVPGEALALTVTASGGGL